MDKLFLITALFLISCKSNCQTNSETKDTFDFKEITFHSSACNGTCPDVSMNIYADKQIELIRSIYKAKGEIDTSNSHAYKGLLSDKDFKKMLELLRKQNWDTLTFPEILCCDRAIRTIIISYNGKHKIFKSMAPPESVHDLIDYLTNLATSVKLPIYTKPIDFEE